MSRALNHHGRDGADVNRPDRDGTRDRAWTPILVRRHAFQKRISPEVGSRMVRPRRRGNRETTSPTNKRHNGSHAQILADKAPGSRRELEAPKPEVWLAGPLLLILNPETGNPVREVTIAPTIVEVTQSVGEEYIYTVQALRRCRRQKTCFECRSRLGLVVVIRPQCKSHSRKDGRALEYLRGKPPL
jgi:hypothetical protein